MRERREIITNIDKEEEMEEREEKESKYKKE